MGCLQCVFNGVGLQRVGGGGTRLETGEEGVVVEPRCAVVRTGTAGGGGEVGWGGKEGFREMDGGLPIFSNC